VKKADANFLPVVQRELREGARRPFNYWLRVGGGAAGVLLLFNTLKGAGAIQTISGLPLFVTLHQTMLLLICVIVPAISAECISREKREGTLGLLFLTPLSAMGIVVGKSLVQMSRAFTLWLAVLPVLIIPFLLGGVTGNNVISALTMEFCVTLLCLAAGIMASSLAKARNTAFLLAACLTVCFLCAFGWLLGVSLQWQAWRVTPYGQQVYTSFLIGRGLLIGQSPNGMVVSSPLGWASYISSPVLHAAWHSILVASLLAVLAAFFLILRFAAYLMKDSWQEKGPSLRRESWIKAYCVPLARDRFKRKLQRMLDWNPIAWLQLYSWKAGVTRWGLCLIFVLFECSLINVTPAELLEAQSTMMMILAAIFTFVSVSGFLTEKKSGALELLLVTPISPNKIIFGRVWGLWLQFLPAAATLILCRLNAENIFAIVTPTSWPRQIQNSSRLWEALIAPASAWLRQLNPSWWGQPVPHTYLEAPSFQIFVIAIGFFTLPVFATYFALRVKNLFVAAALTWLALLLCPYFAFTMLGSILSFNIPLGPAEVGVIIFLMNLAFALLACFLLRHSLSRRLYAF
jgi:ABC-type transport system involved in multi-copper enzyme maturation permease subunit